MTIYQKIVELQHKQKVFTPDFYTSLDKLSYNTKKDDTSKQRKIILSAGHSTKKGEDRGATGNGFIEGVENAKIRKRVADILKTKYNTIPVIDGDETILRLSMNFFTSLIRKNKWNNALAVEIHFNAASSPTANGTETVIPADYTETELNLASELSRGIAGILNTRLRGIVSGYSGVITEASSRAKRLGWMRIPAENALIEICFISNTEEMKKYQENFENICQLIAAVLYHNSLI